MYRNLTLGLLFLFISSCTKTDVNSTSYDKPMASIDNETSTILNSVYVDYYNHFMRDNLGQLNQSPTIEEIDEGTVYVFNSNSVHHSENGVQLNKASFISSIASNGNIIASVHDYSALIITNGVPSSGYISIKLVNGLEIYKIEKNSEGNWTMVDGDDIGVIPTQGVVDGWWSCTVDCYNTLDAACSGDPDCNLMCDLVNLAAGQCTLSMGAACGIYCATNNGVWTPPVWSTNLTVSNQYGFY